MASEFLISFHKKHFPKDDVHMYSKQVFYKLVEELTNLDYGGDRII